jgi:alanine-glyoxylate transaminase/serine-glyoxylate transaminase/serine-pyruvate transaminase
LAPPERILLAPGPTALAESVKRAQTRPLVGHKDPFYLDAQTQTAQMLRMVFQTNHQATMFLPGTGGAGMEASVTNLIQPGDTAIVGINGLFGERVADIVRRCGGTAIEVKAAWGQPIDPGAIRRELDAHPKVRAVFITHGETSTGILQPIDEIGRDAKAHDAFLVVDTVATLGGVSVTPDEWGCDICFSASQKCLSAPPGVSPITVSDRAMEYIRSRKGQGGSWYFDLDLHDRYWFADTRPYHHTAPVLELYALHEAMRLVLIEGLENRFARHELHQEALVAGIDAIDMAFFGNPAYRLPTVLAVRPPEDVDEAKVRAGLLERYNVEIAGGLGQEAGKMWRIGIMGESATEDNMLTLLEAIESLVMEQRGSKSTGSAASAARAVYARHR